MLTAAKLKKLIDEELNSREHTGDYEPLAVRATLDTLRKTLSLIEFDPDINIADLLLNFMVQLESSDESAIEAALRLAQFVGEKKGEQTSHKRKRAVRKKR